MWEQFYLENIHFAINACAALVFFAVSFLYFDAWFGRRSVKELVRALGFLLLSISFLSRASILETTLLPQTILQDNLLNLFYISTHLAGYILIILSLVNDHLQLKPKTTGITKESYTLFLGLPKFSLIIISPVLALFTALLYVRRAFFGLENHLKAISLSFFVLSLFETISLASLLRTTTNIDLYNLVAPFGPIWMTEQATLLLAIIILGRWVFGYLLKQLQTQLMMFFAVGILMIFLLTTITFTSLLIKNLEQETLKQLETNSKVLDLNLVNKEEQNISDAQVIAQNPDIQKAITTKNDQILAQNTQNFLVSKKLASVIILDQNGKVLSRGEDPGRVGDSLSGDALVKRSILGQSVSSIVLRQGVVAPQMVIFSSVPIDQDPKKNIGVVLVGTYIDNVFLDNIKKVSSLEASVYGQDTLVATTLYLPDNKTRAVGIKLSDPKILNPVLKNGQPFLGEANVLNKSYFASFLPLKDINNEVIGMLFVAQLQTGTLATAGKSIELTFILAAALLMLSIIPAAVISKRIADQLH